MDRTDPWVGTESQEVGWGEGPDDSAAEKDGMIEDLITLGHEGSGNGLRHFVAGKPIKRVATWRLNLGTAGYQGDTSRDLKIGGMKCLRDSNFASGFIKRVRLKLFT